MAHQLNENVRRCLSGAAIGALVGAVVGVGGVWREVLEGHREATAAQYGEFALYAATFGVVTGAILASLKRLRGSGRRGYYLAWLIAFLIPSIAVVVLELVNTGNWKNALVILVIGSGGGLGFALFTRQIAGNWW